MQEAFDLSSVRQTLRKYLNYRWTLEQLDRPSGGWDMCEREWRKHKLNLKQTHRMHRNLLRDESDTDIL
jgi:hypothetical protein